MGNCLEGISNRGGKNQEGGSGGGGGGDGGGGGSTTGGTTQPTEPTQPTQPTEPEAKSIKVAGVTTQTSDGSVPVRLEVRALQSSRPAQFNLFILALQSLQSKPPNDPLSYYQLAGIHGMPYKPWNGATSRNVREGQWDFGGYCTHSSILFIPWHRPFLALLEQALHAEATRIAEQFPADRRGEYVEAAKTLRLPYFDWGVRVQQNESAFPDPISRETVRVVDTDGASKDIPNPLYTFNIAAVSPPSGDLSGGWDPSRRPTTLRHPDRQGRSRNFIVADEMLNESASLRSEISILLLSYTDFDIFSNSRWRPGGGSRTYSSLEGIHDDIHGRCGGSGGHMGALDVSAMDPVFWLHHCNVDRMWAIWQVLNPNAQMTPRPAPYTTFSTRGGQMEDSKSPLAPFWSDNQAESFWDSEGADSTHTFGYAYPETQRWNFETTAAHQQDVRGKIAQLYGSNPFTNFVANIAPRDEALNRPTIRVSKMAVRSAAKPGVQGGSEQKPLTFGGDSGAPPFLSLAAAPPLDTQWTLASDNPIEKDQKKLASPPEEESKKDEPSHDHDLSQPIPPEVSHLAPDNAYKEWIVNVRALKHGLGQTYRVIIFLGDFSSAPDDWAGSGEYNTVGRVTVLGRSSNTQCEKCRDDMNHDVYTTGTVPLTGALLQDVAAGKLRNLEVEDVVAYLTRNLHWRVKTFEGVEISRSEVPGLKVEVSSMEARIDDMGVPVYSGEYVEHREITDGRPGGLNVGDEI